MQHDLNVSFHTCKQIAAIKRGDYCVCANSNMDVLMLTVKDLGFDHQYCFRSDTQYVFNMKLNLTRHMLPPTMCSQGVVFLSARLMLVWLLCILIGLVDNSANMR